MTNGIFLPRGGRSEIPTAPPEIREAVELYARENGRAGSIQYIPPPVGAWEVRLSLRPNDERMRLYQMGLAPEPPVETVLLIEPNPDFPARSRLPNRPMDIYQMGASGVRAHLERGNTWSGRGEFRSVQQAVRHAHEATEAAKDRARTDARDNAVDRAKDKRRQYEKIPFLPVGINLNQKNG